MNLWIFIYFGVFSITLLYPFLEVYGIHSWGASMISATHSNKQQLLQVSRGLWRRSGIAFCGAFLYRLIRQTFLSLSMNWDAFESFFLSLSWLLFFPIFLPCFFSFFLLLSFFSQTINPSPSSTPSCLLNIRSPPDPLLFRLSCKRSRPPRNNNQTYHNKFQ